MVHSGLSYPAQIWEEIRIRRVTLLPSSTNAWAAGYYYNGTVWQTFIIHWDGTAWSVSPSPNAGASNNFLEAISAISADDIWAVGRWGTSSGLTLHWDGMSWNVIESASSTGTKYLNGVSAQATDYVWAVGNNVNGAQQTLTQLYSAACTTPSVTPTSTDAPTDTPTATDTPTFTDTPTMTPTITPTQVCGLHWRLIDSDDPGSIRNDLKSVAAIAPYDVWAVGAYNDGGSDHTLTEHWDGGAWVTVPSPNSGTGDNKLTSVSAVSFNDVWAVGSYAVAGTGAVRTLTEHWDGTAWTIVSSPNLGSGNNYLQGVVAFSANDVWAAGYSCGTDCMPVADAQSLILHWDGTAWSVSTTPNLAGQNNYLWAVAGSGPDDMGCGRA